ncbi:MAG: GNAT family N-acetyltransferase [Candidatus Dormibacteraeota bacterium]|nr:GNAT family N-acetyltransferase [Candidatus Dormibacteraeota bacterium]
MPELITPSPAAAASVREAARLYGEDAMPEYGRQVADLGDDELEAYVQRLLADTREGTPRPPGYVPSTHLWWVEGHQFLGRVHIRHRLTPDLLTEGGHLGYHVVPPHRRLGHGTAMLAAALPVARALGIPCLLLTCDAHNHGSRRVIEANGGLFEGERAGSLRYWVPTT